MLTLGPIGFVVPWLLAALLVLPVLWWLLRAIPPKPTRRKFPGVRLLLGLKDPDKMPDRTPWWLLLLRIVALAMAILAFAGPLLNPEPRQNGTGPLLLLVDASWAMAPQWSATQAKLADALERAERDGRPVAVHSMAAQLPPDNALPFQDAGDWLQRLAGLEPQPWAADRAGFAAWLQGANVGDFETQWFSDGLLDADDAALFAVLQSRGSVTFFPAENPVVGLTPPRVSDNGLALKVLRSVLAEAVPLTIQAIGPDPTGIERVLGQGLVTFDSQATSAEVALEMPVELRNRVTRIGVQGLASAGATVLLDDGSKRRKVGLLAGAADQEGQQYISPLFYLRKALETSADLIEAPLADTLLAAPDVMILADVGTLSDTETEALTAWVETGGLLVRFAGPRLAQSGAGQLDDDPLLPVRLRSGGRNVSGAMSWGDPKGLRAFPENGPFQGLAIPAEVTVTAQVVAQPDPDLPARVLAALDDGTPMVTGRALGEGRVILFHVTANAEWSNLPLSGLFVQMLERLAISARSGAAEASELAGQIWVPVRVLNGFGQVVDAPALAGVPGERLAEGKPGPDAPPGLYAAAERQVAIYLLTDDDELTPMNVPPAGVTMGQFGATQETDLKPWLLAFALLTLLADISATLWLGGRLTGPRVAKTAVFALAFALCHSQADAQNSDAAAINATNETVLAYVLTGDNRVDGISYAGLFGLSRVLIERTSVEPIEPIGINLETDELAFYPFLYWPISELQSSPSDAAYTKINTYLRNGGMILFDTRDADLGVGFGASPNGRVLQRLATKLDIPALEPMPADHVLTRTFYLLQEFPGRWTGSDVWVEAAPNAEQVEGMPFRNLNDGVTPVIIGANDWASAWALTADGQPMFPIGRGIGGERQREIAWRFGVNIIMHVMTGNYKSDQVHVPALLERLGQ